MSRFVVIVLALLTGVTATTTASAASSTYDAPAVVRFGVHEIGVVEASPVQLSIVQEVSALPFVEARGRSTTPLARVVATNTVDDVAAAVARPDLANVTSKIQRQMQTRGWTPDLIDEAATSGVNYPAVNKLGGANTPATRYVSPTTGQSVVIDNATGEIIQVGGPGFKYGP